MEFQHEGCKKQERLVASVSCHGIILYNVYKYPGDFSPSVKSMSFSLGTQRTGQGPLGKRDNYSAGV